MALPILLTRVGTSDVPLPRYATAGAVGADLAAAISETLVIGAGEFQLVPCGFSVAIPDGFEAQIRPRSGLASKHGVTVLNAPGTIDSDYRGEVKVLLINLGHAPFTVTPGMRIAQMVVAPVTRAEWKEVAELPITERNTGGFGHSGT